MESEAQPSQAEDAAQLQNEAPNEEFIRLEGLELPLGITDDKFKALLLEYLDPNGVIGMEGCEIIDRRSGSHNHCVILSLKQKRQFADGDITGLIDWEGARTVPRCVGYSALPWFLREDWRVGYTLKKAIQTPWSLEEYRKIYSRHMENVLGVDSDAVNTAKSTLYCAAFDAIHHLGTKLSHVLDIIYSRLPNLRLIPEEEILRKLGQSNGWPAEEKVLREGLKKLFEPEPGEDYTEEDVERPPKKRRPNVEEDDEHSTEQNI